MIPQANQTIRASLGPADRLLLAAARVRPSAGTRRRITGLLGESIDWERLVRRALHHQVSPLVRRTLLSSESWAAQVPSGVRQTLDREYRASTARGLLLFHDLGTVLRSAATAGIPVVVLKGAALAGPIYGHASLRPMRDVDLLVRPTDLPALLDALEHRGFVVPSYSTAPAYYSVTCRHPDTGVTFDVHWALQESLGLVRPDLGALWSRSETISFDGVAARRPAWEDCVLHACMHVDKHGYANGYLRGRSDAAGAILEGKGDNALKWFCDLRELVSLPGTAIDLGRVATEARRWSVEAAVADSLALTEQLFGPTPATSELSALARPELRRFERRVLAALIARDGSPREGPVSSGATDRLWSLARAYLRVRPVRLLSLVGHLVPRSASVARHYDVQGPTVAALYARHVARTLSRSARSAVGWLRLAADKARRQWVARSARRRRRGPGNSPHRPGLLQAPERHHIPRDRRRVPVDQKN